MQTSLKNSIQSEQILKLWEESHQSSPNTKDFINFIHQSSALNSMGKSKNQVVAFVNFAEQKILSISDNYREILNFGSSDEDFYNNGLSYFLNAIRYEECKYFADISEFFIYALRPIVHQNIDYTFFSSGFHLSIPGEEKSKRIAFIGIPTEFRENMPITMMLIFNDITHLVKEDDRWWCRLQLKHPEQQNMLYHSENPVFTKQELLSKREMEIVNLFNEGKGLSEIADSLNLSYHTIDNHKKSILAKTGAINSTAALKILKIGNII